MSLISTARFLERMQFFNGQRLFAGDLTALDAFNRDMRWLHNQSLHQPGVGFGFAITGGKGDREVTIQPGYAIDDLGREIVLTETHVEPVPPVADDGFGGPVYFDLTVAYPNEADLPVSETRESVCDGVGVVRRLEQPLFCWARLGPPPDRLPVEPLGKTVLREQTQTGRRIRLARAAVLNCQLEQPLSIAQRRNAKPPSQPYVAAGRGIPGSDNWEVKGPKDTSGFGYQLSISVGTTSACFRSKPVYLAQVAGDRVFDFPQERLKRVLDGFLTVNQDKSSATRLAVEVLIPQTMVGGGDVTQQLLDAVNGKNHQPWVVEWVGVES